MRTYTLSDAVPGLKWALASLVLLSAQAAAADGPMVVNLSLAPPTLDPTYVCDIADNGFISTLYAPLLKYEAKPVANASAKIAVTTEDTTKIVGYLAESYEVSADGKTLSLHLRPGLKFPSGNPIDAAAVKASLEYGMKSTSCGSYYAVAGQFGNVTAIEAPDASTVVISLVRPEALMLHTLTQPNTGIIDMKTAQANGGGEWLASHAAGYGPYLLKSYEPGVRAVFSANPDFIGEKPIEPEVLVNFITDNATLLLAARNNQADVTLGLSKSAVASLTGTAGLEVVTVPTARWQLIGFPTQVKPFDNAKFREALTLAVPYDAIVKTVAHGLATPFYGPFPPQFPAFDPALGAPRPFDIAKAKELVAASGVTLPVQAEMVIREGQNDQEQIATIVQSSWRELGVEISIRKLATSAYSEAVNSLEKRALIVRFDGPSVDDPAWLLDYDMRCKSQANVSNYCNPEADKLLDEAHVTLDADARKAIWSKIAQIWVADSPRVVLYADNFSAVLSDRMKTWHFAQDGPFDINLWGRSP